MSNINMSYFGGIKSHSCHLYHAAYVFSFQSASIPIFQLAFSEISGTRAWQGTQDHWGNGVVFVAKNRRKVAGQLHTLLAVAEAP